MKGQDATIKVVLPGHSARSAQRKINGGMTRSEECLPGCHMYSAQTRLSLLLPIVGKSGSPMCLKNNKTFIPSGKGFSRVVLVVLVPSRPVAEMKHLPVRDSLLIEGVLPPISGGFYLPSPKGLAPACLSEF